MLAQNYTGKQKNWTLGLGFNSIIDSGESINDVFDIGQSHHFSNPFKISLEKKINSIIGVEIRGTSNKYKESKKFNSGFLREDISFLSIDSSVKYYFTNKPNGYNPSKFEGYGIGGIGISWYNGANDQNIHIGGGINYKINKNLHLNFQSIGKLSVRSGSNSNNYIQLDLGVLLPFSF